MRSPSGLVVSLEPEGADYAVVSAIGSNLEKGCIQTGAPHADVALVGCGAAGAIAGIFKSSIAGLVFHWKS